MSASIKYIVLALTRRRLSSQRVYDQLTCGDDGLFGRIKLRVDAEWEEECVVPEWCFFCT